MLNRSNCISSHAVDPRARLECLLVVEVGAGRLWAAAVVVKAAMQWGDNRGSDHGGDDRKSPPDRHRIRANVSMNHQMANRKLLDDGRGGRDGRDDRDVREGRDGRDDDDDGCDHVDRIAVRLDPNKPDPTLSHSAVY